MNLVNQMNEILTDEIIEYTMSLFVDTRFQLSITRQYTDIPPELHKAVDFLNEHKDMLIRSFSEYNVKSYSYAKEIKRTNDPLRRIALWGSYIKKYGREQ